VPGLYLDETHQPAIDVLRCVRDVIVGGDALRAGELTRYQVRTGFRAIYPGIYLARHVEPTLRIRSEAAWLWSGRRGVLAGLAASALHGSSWVDDDEPVELIWQNQHSPAGVITRRQRLESDEITRVAGLPVTTPARTAFDLGRRLPAGQAVARLDALMRAKPFSAAEVSLLAQRHPGTRGLRRLKVALPRMDAGAASPKETWLRLLLIDAGFPIPQTQIPVVANYRTVAFLDMGWERYKVAVEYDGDQHRTNRRQYVRDMRRVETLEELGWIVIRVVAEDRPESIVRKAREALRRRDTVSPPNNAGSSAPASRPPRRATSRPLAAVVTQSGTRSFPGPG